MTSGAEIAVLDVGKTNVRLWAACADGTLIDHRATPNTVREGPPWRHHDLERLGGWLGRSLSDLCAEHPIRVVVPVGHGSGGVLVASDPDAPGNGAALPMIDYEQPSPPAIEREYAAKAGTFEDRGSPVMMASTHAARQLLRMERSEPARFAEAAHYLNVAQYWGWWLTGMAASEYSAMGAQSHLWNVPQRRWTPIVQGQGWRRLLPDMSHAWAPLGPLRPRLRQQFGLPEGITVLTGAHDSSANFHRYRAAGLRDFTLVSTGTWIVAMSQEADISRLDEARGTTINADMEGNPVAGALVMGGREFSAIAGEGAGKATADAEVLARVVRRGTIALPSFGTNDGQFPGSAGCGRIVGPPPENQPERDALALLHVSLLTVTCADILRGGPRLILDGTFLKEPLFAPLVAALRDGRPTETSDEPEGVVTGAVRLATHGQASTPVTLNRVEPLGLAGLSKLAETWRQLAEQQGTTYA